MVGVPRKPRNRLAARFSRPEVLLLYTPLLDSRWLIFKGINVTRGALKVGVGAWVGVPMLGLTVKVRWRRG
ncbi:hypothetical protein MA16_Dca014374 [Dendrobium catenatum]|uniref:Uncharacterized protein n=1 Tax=Dendrobium catenatum TaxID=906689 RepID=A0A2I0WWG9_9ASPA|nr:hypothetical protein MA16_Dca014374 [Dendrobium catenatum]